MTSSKIIGVILVIAGIVGLCYGVFSLTSGDLGEGLAWGAAILGIVFFTSGIGLMKSVSKGDASGA